MVWNKGLEIVLMGNIKLPLRLDRFGGNNHSGQVAYQIFLRIWDKEGVWLVCYYYPLRKTF